jgi:hypothetical protein
MDVFLLQVVSAFLLFAVILPLFGVVLGFFLFYLLPYLFGGVVMAALALLVGAKILLTWWVWLAALAWAFSVHFIRRRLKELGHEIEHHHAANMVLLGGLPYHRRKRQLAILCTE